MAATGVVASGLAHDFNNLLTVVLTMTQLSMSQVAEQSEVKEYLTLAETAVKRAAELARQLLTYSGRRSIPTVEQLSANVLVSEMVELLESVVSTNSTVKTELSELWPKIVGDAGQLRQVVMNLLTNANEALRDLPGEIVLRTGVTAVCEEEGLSVRTGNFLGEAEGPYPFIEVEDTGCGLSDGAMARMFEPFFTTKTTGRGLGMDVVLGIMREHKGAVVVRSTLGEGTLVRVLFPCSSDDDSEPEDMTKEFVV